jgi:hypothetical protein
MKLVEKLIGSWKQQGNPDAFVAVADEPLPHIKAGNDVSSILLSPGHRPVPWCSEVGLPAS